MRAVSSFLAFLCYICYNCSLTLLEVLYFAGLLVKLDRYTIEQKNKEPQKVIQRVQYSRKLPIEFFLAVSGARSGWRVNRSRILFVKLDIKYLTMDIIFPGTAFLFVRFVHITRQVLIKESTKKRKENRRQC